MTDLDLAAVEAVYQTLRAAEQAQHRAAVSVRAAQRVYRDMILPALRERIKAIEKISGRGLYRFSDNGRIGDVDIIRRRRDGAELLRIKVHDASDKEPCDTLLMPLDWLNKSVEECCTLTMQLRDERRRSKRATVCAPVQDTCEEQP